MVPWPVEVVAVIAVTDWVVTVGAPTADVVKLSIDPVDVPTEFTA